MDQVLRMLVTIAGVIFLGMGSRSAGSCFRSEIPILIQLGIPEQYHINSYTALITNIAFIAPVLFLVFTYFMPCGKNRPEIPINYAITLLGTTASCLLIFLWNDHTTWQVDKSTHSTSLFVLLLLLSVVTSTSDVTFVAYMSLLKETYLNWFWVGQGFGAFLPSLLVLFQGLRKQCIIFPFNSSIVNDSISNKCTVEPDGGAFSFYPDEYFSVLFTLMLLCQLSFILMNTLPIVKKEYAASHGEMYNACGRFTGDGTSSEIYLLESMPSALTRDSPGYPPGDASQDSDDESDVPYPDWRPQPVHVLYLMSFLTSFLLHGIMHAVESYSAGAYGESAFRVIVPLRQMAVTATYLIFLVKPIGGLKVILVSFFLGLAAATYCLIVAIMGPNPPLQGTVAGQVLVAMAWLCEGLFLHYCKTAIMWMLRLRDASRKHLIWGSVIGQIGGLAGALLMFFLVNSCKLFHVSLPR